jgi:phosphoglycerate dehydrogenase-like enzyme
VKGWRFDGAPLIGRVRGRTFGVVGLGRIGTATALRAKALGCEVGFFDPYNVAGVELALDLTRFPSLGALLQAADIVSIHVPSTAETRGMFGRAVFAQMRPGAILINTARGGVVDLDALHEALKAGRIGGAALDVLPSEPPSPDHPLLVAWRAREPWIEGRFLVTPHAAFYSAEGIVDMRRKGAETAVAGARGELRNCVNRAELGRA